MQGLLRGVLCFLLSSLVLACSPTNNAPTTTATSMHNAAAFSRNITQTALRNMRYRVTARNNVTCNYVQAKVRKEFRSMSKPARTAFTKAITCLQRLSPQQMYANQSSRYPGVKSRYDEYIATHINYTYNIHMTADFFAWHRFFIFQFERDLQQLCHYNGTLPYWDWQIDADAPQDSEIFNGNPYSMGSNGAYVADRANTWLGPQQVDLPPGTGGGCVVRGPFSNYTVNLGPIDSPIGGNVNSSYAHNPRCLVRDLNPWISQRYNTYDNVTSLILNFDDIISFQAEAQGYGSSADRFGVHGGGHWLGGTPSTLEDFHSSPGDPIFYLHHAMIDRIWMTWQHLNVSTRLNAISGTSTLNNEPPSAEMTLDDMLPFGFVAKDQRFGDLMDTFAGPFCYRYD